MSFEPDVKALRKKFSTAVWDTNIRAAISAYEQQREAAGWVSVRREDLSSIMRRTLTSANEADEAADERILEIL